MAKTLKPQAFLIARELRALISLADTASKRYHAERKLNPDTAKAYHDATVKSIRAALARVAASDLPQPVTQEIVSP